MAEYETKAFEGTRTPTATSSSRAAGFSTNLIVKLALMLLFFIISINI